MQKTKPCANAIGKALAITVLMLALTLVALATPAEKAHAETPPGGFAPSYSGTCHIGSTWQIGSQNYFIISSFSGDLSGAVGVGSFECINPTAAAPSDVDAGYVATYAGKSIEGRWVEYEVVVTPPDATDGVTSNERGLIGYQRVKGRVRLGWEPTGTVKLAKGSADPSIARGNDCYSLDGAEYGIYETREKASADEDRLKTLNTGSDGASNEVELDAGAYWVKEVKAPAGYAKDAAPHELVVEAGGNTTLSVEDAPQSDLPRAAVRKLDADFGTMAQGGATLEGAEYTFRFYAGGYFDSSNLPSAATRMWVLKTDAKGSCKLADGDSLKVSGDEFFRNGDGAICVPLGTLTVTETKAPEGYRLGHLDSDGEFHDPETAVYQVKPNSNGGAGASTKLVEGPVASANEPLVTQSVETPVRGNLKGAKADSASVDGKAQGGATLAGAKVAVINKNQNAVLSPEDGTTEVGYGGIVCVLETDEGGVFDTTASDVNGWAMPVAFGGCALPYGTYEVREIEPPAGYNLNAAWSGTVTVGAQGEVALAGFEDDVIRGDFELCKIAGDTQHPIVGVPFVVTSDTTGEQHVMVTDANGFISSAAAYRAHTAKTNANDAAVIMPSPADGEGADEEDAVEEDADGGGEYAVDESALVNDAGVWFAGRARSGGAPADDALGALPYDTYTVDEVRCKANEGYELIRGYKVTVSSNDWKIGPVTIEDEVSNPTISTTLTDAADGDHEIALSGSQTVIDRVTYKGLVPSRQYTACLELHRKNADGTDGGVLLDADGNPVTARQRFFPQSPDGVVDVRVTFVPADEEECSIVAFEEIRYRDAVYAVHADISDEAQTVRASAPSGKDEDGPYEPTVTVEVHGETPEAPGDAPEPPAVTDDEDGEPFDKTGYWFARYWWVLGIFGIALLLVGAIRRRGSAKPVRNGENG